MSTNAEVFEEITRVSAVPVEKLPASIIMEQLGYVQRVKVVPKRQQQRVERKVTASTQDILQTHNFKVMDRFDTFWSSVRSIGGLKRIRKGRKVRTKSVPIDGRHAPVGAIHRGARSADATHLLASLGKEK